jgi:lysophospholipase II
MILRIRPRMSSSSSRKVAETIALEAPGEHTASFIFCHGLGDQGHGWAEEFEQLRRNGKLSKHLKMIFPNAPHVPITLNGGMRMPGWYDLKSLDDRADEPCDGIEESRQQLLAAVEAELNECKIDASRVIVGGFSQGGALALFTAYQSNLKLGGVVGLSTYLPRPNDVVANLTDEAKDTPLFMGHGDRDPLVLPAYGRQSFEMLRKSGVHNAEMKSYRGVEHSVNLEEMLDAAKWIEARLSQ